MCPISNAADRPLNENTGTLPDVADALTNYFQPITFTQIVKSVVAFDASESPTNITFMGVWQPLSTRDLALKPEGQRDWSWYRLHAEPAVQLSPDDVVTYLGKQFRVKGTWDYKLYGYMEYQLVEDYTGAGPNL